MPKQSRAVEVSGQRSGSIAGGAGVEAFGRRKIVELLDIG